MPRAHVLYTHHHIHRPVLSTAIDFFALLFPALPSPLPVFVPLRPAIARCSGWLGSGFGLRAARTSQAKNYCMLKLRKTHFCGGGGGQHDTLFRATKEQISLASRRIACLGLPLRLRWLKHGCEHDPSSAEHAKRPRQWPGSSPKRQCSAFPLLKGTNALSRLIEYHANFAVE
jgi:hypothetical protein